MADRWEDRLQKARNCPNVVERLLAESSTVMIVTVRDLGWRKLEDWREVKVLYGKRLAAMGSSRLVRKLTDKTKNG